MTDYTAAEVKPAIEPESWNELSYEETGYKLAILLRDEAVLVEIVAKHEGGEYGYATFIVFKVGTQYFRKEGFYQSHYGNDWDGSFEEVQPVLKQVSDWEVVS